MTGRPTASEAPRSEVVDQDLLGAARVLRETLTRVHPSFRFEERLRARLASGDGDVLDGAVVIPFPVPAPMAALEGLPAAFETDARLATTMAAPAGPDRLARWGQVPRGALIGGAIASGFSLAGAALIARRLRHRPPRAVASGRGAA